MPGMIVGYARTSTAEQDAGLEGQLRDLTAAGCERIWQEKTSALGARPQLDAVLDFIRDGDTLIVTKPCRLARGTANLLDIVDNLDKRGIGLIILSMAGGRLDTRSPTSKLTLTILAAVAQFEREIMLERQREGIAKAKREGKYRGRAPTARAKADDVRRLKAEGVGGSEIARKLGISRMSVHRILKGD